jgi:signal transduction histidine kinase
MIMRQLWVRLSLAFGAVVFLSFALVAILSVTIIRANAERSFDDERLRIVDGLIERLANFYVENTSWEGVDDLFQGAEVAFPTRMFQGGVLLTDSTNNTIYGEIPDGFEVDTATPIVVNEQAVGTLIVAKPILPPNGPLGPGFWIFRDMVRWDELLILLTFVGGIVSLLFGTLISRWLTNPLDDLAKATNDIGAGHLSRRVEETGTAELKTLAESFNRMVDQLHNAEILRRNLVADVAHELRTPITALQANLYAILDDAYPMTKTEIAGLYEQTRTLSRLVTDLHDIAQAEAKQLPMNCQRANLGNIVEEIAAPFSVVAESKNISFEVQIGEMLPYISLDRQRITQVINNLLSNALRHTPEGGKITIRVDQSDGELQIRIKDTGEGISPEHLPHVFDRFYRADSGRSRDLGGTGLGLAIVKAIVSAHGGKVTAESAVGQGTTMLIALPVAV